MYLPWTLSFPSVWFYKASTIFFSIGRVTNNQTRKMFTDWYRLQKLILVIEVCITGKPAVCLISLKYFLINFVIFSVIEVCITGQPAVYLISFKYSLIEIDLRKLTNSKLQWTDSVILLNLLLSSHSSTDLWCFMIGS